MQQKTERESEDVGTPPEECWEAAQAYGKMYGVEKKLSESDLDRLAFLAYLVWNGRIEP